MASEEHEQQDGGDGAAARPPTLREVLAPLLELPERPAGAQQLCAALELLEATQHRLQHRKSPEEEALSDQDSILLMWLAGVYHGISGSQAIIHGDLLQPQLTASGMVAPFVQPVPAPRGEDGAQPAPRAARFGVPNSTDVLCDNASELLRMAAAALLSLYVYLNFTQGPGDLPADEVTLVFATCAIHSCAAAANAATIDGQLAGLARADLDEHASASPWHALAQRDAAAPGAAEAGGDDAPAFGCAQIRWVMHYIRSLVSHHMGAVAHILGRKEQQAECYAAQLKDAQYMVKALPDHPLGYSLFARCAMNAQQMSMAAAFLAKGLDVAAAAGSDAGEACMSFQRAAALLLGGGGDAIDAADIQGLVERGEAARQRLLAWFPTPWRRAADDGEPDRSLVLQKLLPAWAERNGVDDFPERGEVEPLRGLLYVTRAPQSVPAGALQHIVEGAEGESEGGA